MPSSVENETTAESNGDDKPMSSQQITNSYSQKSATRSLNASTKYDQTLTTVWDNECPIGLSDDVNSSSADKHTPLDDSKTKYYQTGSEQDIESQSSHTSDLYLSHQTSKKDSLDLLKEHAPSFQEISMKEIGYNPEVFENENQLMTPLCNKIGKKIKEIVMNQHGANVSICIGQFTFKCHLIVLQCMSKFFRDHANAVLIELPETHVVPSAFTYIYDSFLNEKICVKRELLCALFKTSRYLKIKVVEDMCWTCISNESKFSEENACLLYLEAKDDVYLHPLAQLMQQRVQKFFLSFVATSDFVELAAEQVLSFLELDSIGLISEINAVCTAVRWLSHDWQNRKKHVLTIMKAIRWEQVPELFLAWLICNVSCKLFKRITSDPLILPLIQDALVNVILRKNVLSACKDTKSYLDALQKYNLKEPRSRWYIKDPHYSHDNHISDPMTMHYVYHDFMIYLQLLKNSGCHYWKTLKEA